MRKKYRFDLDGVDYVVSYNDDGRVGRMVIWNGDQVHRALTIMSELPKKDGDFVRILREEMDDPYLEIEPWVDLTVHLNLTTTVSVSLSAFECDDMRDVMNDLLETSFRDKVLAIFRRELAMDPYIEVAFVEEGRCANHIGDEEVACYLAERG